MLIVNPQLSNHTNVKGPHSSCLSALECFYLRIQIVSASESRRKYRGWLTIIRRRAQNATRTRLNFMLFRVAVFFVCFSFCRLHIAICFWSDIYGYSCWAVQLLAMLDESLGLSPAVFPRTRGKHTQKSIPSIFFFSSNDCFYALEICDSGNIFLAPTRRPQQHCDCFISWQNVQIESD